MQRAEQRSFLVAPWVTVVRSVFPVAFPLDCRICSLPLTNISRFAVCEECLDSIDAGVLPAAQVPGRLAEAIAQLGCNDENAKPVPVPLHSSERGERGLNQAELIVRSALKHLPRRMEVARVLKRQRAMHSQFELIREERVANMRGAFRVTDHERVKGRTMILVDDVMATATTVSEGARVWKKAEAERVWAGTLTRTLKEAALPVSVGKEEENEAAEMAVWV
jgi:predicted amidophosphoribosyltransferase